ncbi:ATP-dependent RNA helicase DbpA [Bdellovibrio sp. HCB2-146]|uniref:ATP-dependent RNA helicase DbpA n=1 Tax=Bdellovibrio sp. HCB2-146 TaxID=3394362 RepID=UPI0039BD1948
MKDNSFSTLPLSPELLTVVQELGYESLTPIQAQSIPLLLAGKDLIGQSKTGSGKTAAFALPILNKLRIDDHYLQALVLCPTRELATQVVAEMRKLGRRHVGLQILGLTGGTTGREQAKSLEKGTQIAVGTPGRVLDMINRERIDLTQIETFILDEADKMLDMGFIQEIKSIIKALPQKRQTALFSATFPEEIQDLSRRYQKNPVRVTIEEAEGSEAAIEQFAYDSAPNEKVNTLLRILQQHIADSVIIFCNTKATVNQIEHVLKQQGVSCACLHGDLEQRDRDRVMTMFRNGSHRILVATDVAARGLDIDSLELVVNFDLPLQVDTYVHRIGRTGRAGKTGVAVSITDQRDTLRVMEFEQATKGVVQRPALGFKNQYGLGKVFRESPMTTLGISGGRKDKIRPGDILGALTGEKGLQGSSIGKIEVQDKYSYVAVQSELANMAFEKLRNGRIKGQKFQIKIMK